MTGPFGRFRAWVGSLFGTTETVETADAETANADTAGAGTGESETADAEATGVETADDEATDVETADAEATDVETADGEPPNAETSDPPSSGSAEVTAELLEQAIAEAESTPTTETVRRERAADAADAEDSPFELEGGPKTVRVPSDGTETDAAGADAADAADASETTDAADGDTDPTPTDYAYRCTVCGTGVETPDVPCPLCHASAIVPTDDAGDVYDGADDSPEASGPIGETTTSISDADDAVERLRDLRNDEE